MQTQYPKDMGAIRSMATRAVMEKTDRLLGWNGRVKVLKPQSQPEDDSTNAPAWTNGKTITINGRQEPLRSALMNGFSKDTLLLATGLNYHELAHCFFTPRLDSDYCAMVRQHGWFHSLNALEDQAAESRFVRLYNPSRHYFTAIIAQLMLNGDQEMLTKNYPLIAGRKFLPPEMRRIFRSNFVRPDLVPDFEKVIDDYCDTLYPDDVDEMFALVKRYQELLNDVMGLDLPQLTSNHGNVQGGDGSSAGHGISAGEMLPADERRRVCGLKPIGEDISEEPLEERKDEGESEDEKLADVAADPDLADPDPDPNSSPDPASGDDSSGEDGAQGDSEGPSEGSDGDASDESRDPATADGGDPGGRGAGTSKERSAKYMPDDVDEILTDAIDDAFEEIGQDLDRREDAIRASEGQYQVDSRQSAFDNRSVESHHIHIVRQVEKALRRLNQKFKPGWHRRQESGKLSSNDMARMKRGETDVFRRFSPGINNALSFEVVLLLDQSGSMGNYVKQSSEALWILHSAMKSVGAEVTALGFSDFYDCQVLMQRGMTTPNQIRNYTFGGSTYVMPALAEASRIFRASRKPLRLCVIVTDGGFSDQSSAQDWIRDSRDPVAIVGIGIDVSRWFDDKYRSLKVCKTIQSPLDLVPLVQELVIRLSKDRFAKR